MLIYLEVFYEYSKNKQLYQLTNMKFSIDYNWGRQEEIKDYYEVFHEYPEEEEDIHDNFIFIELIGIHDRNNRYIEE